MPQLTASRFCQIQSPFDVVALVAVGRKQVPRYRNLKTLSSCLPSQKTCGRLLCCLPACPAVLLGQQAVLWKPVPSRVCEPLHNEFWYHEKISLGVRRWGTCVDIDGRKNRSLSRTLWLLLGECYSEVPTCCPHWNTPPIWLGTYGWWVDLRSPVSFQLRVRSTIYIYLHECLLPAWCRICFHNLGDLFTHFFTSSLVVTLTESCHLTWRTLVLLTLISISTSSRDPFAILVTLAVTLWIPIVSPLSMRATSSS